MLDSWSYVVAAYAVAAAGLVGYWRFLARRERALATLASRRRPQPGAAPRAEGGRTMAETMTPVPGRAPGRTPS